MEIKRDRYLNELILRKHNTMIKIVTGIRRCGKSYLLFTLFYRHLIETGTNPDHIITMNLEDMDNIQYRSPEKLLAYIKSRITDSGWHYILLDEVQKIPDFEELLNTLCRIPNIDTYVTGSNSKFLSHDVITEFRGRGDEVHLFPLSFREYMSVSGKDRYQSYEEYFKYGGMPYLCLCGTEQQKTQYLESLFRETYILDILERNKFRNTEDLENLIDILSSSVGSLTNPKRIADTFQSVLHTTVSQITVKKYLDALEDAFLIKGVKRFDVRGRKYIGSPLKYYFEDIGLRNVRLNYRQQEENYIMENIIYNELRVRGYSVDVGVVEKTERDSTGKVVRKKLEIDFVANQGSRKYYIQSAFALSGDEKEHQEKKSLLNTDDSFKKIIVTKDYAKIKRDENGILTIGIMDFLLDENSL
ncbi:MAG TPA: ATP-binding protein, partial [Methanocorpusculum sp.]|nr:ATP-binding protein [Methanocorpusculum sp.]